MRRRGRQHDYSQFHGPRKYINAVPACGFVDHWPSEEQMIALHEAKRLAVADCERVKRRRSEYPGGHARVKVCDGSLSFAAVHLRADGSFTSFILHENSASSGGICHTKQWSGVPEWAPEPQHHGAQTTMSPFKRIRGREVDIRAPETQVQVVYHDTHIVHQDRFFHHRPDAQHIEQGQPERVQIGIDPTQVRVHQSENVRVEHHEPKQPAWRAILLGVKKPQQPALPRHAPQPERQPALAPPRSVDRGMLIPAPQQQPRPLAIAHQPEMPISAPRKKSWSIL